MRRCVSLTVAVAAATAASTGCLPAYFREVDPSFVTVAPPVTSVTPSATAATLVVYDPGIGTRGAQQALTLVLKDGTALGQAPPKAWVALEVPPGTQTIAAGVPEIGHVRPCTVHTWTFEAGKIYLLNRGLSPPEAGSHPERSLSITSRLSVDRAAGQARVREQWDDFWKPCIADAQDAQAKFLADPEVPPELRERFRREQDGLGQPLDQLTIPEPP
jgi:hypothetical protein